MISETFRAELEKMGEAQVKALVESTDDSRWSVACPLLAECGRMGAYEWLNEKQAGREAERFNEANRWVRWTAIASWVVAGISLIVGSCQVGEAERARRDALVQSEELLRVQVTNEFDNEWDSIEMRQARRRIAVQLLKGAEITELRIPDFFDKVGLYYSQRRIDELSAYNEFASAAEEYWPALKNVILKSRVDDNAPDEYIYFELFYKAMLLHDAKANKSSVSGETPTREDVMEILEREKRLPR